MEERILARASDLGGIFSFTEVLSCVLAAFTSARNPEDVSPNVHARADINSKDLLVKTYDSII